MLTDGQDYGDNIRIFLRIRPALDLDSQEQLHLHSIAVQPLDSQTIQLRSGSKVEKFSYDAVGGPDVSQESVFRVVGKPITDNCLQGYNGTIFAYGQTGSGKTFTMQGPLDAQTGLLDFNMRGVIPRCFEYLFGVMAREEKRSGGCIEYLCRASFCEIYNEFIYDLLDPTSPACSIREDLKRGVYVDGITEEIVASPEDAYRILETGAQNRHVASTSMNRESSRSHSVFTLIIQSKITDGDITDVRESRFNLVDLAGSERQKLTATTGVRLKEAGNINKSLLALGNVINALVDISNGKTRHIHYRDSKLTFLLRDSLGGNAKTFIIANVSPTMSCHAETLSTLRFASRAKMIKNRAIVNQEFQGNVLKLQEEIKRLKHELLLSQAQSSSSIAFAEFEDFSLNDLDSNNRQHRLMALISCILQRYRKSENEKLNMLERMEALQRVADSQKNQIQSDKMIIKFRDNTINMLRKKGIEPVDEEKERMKQEIAELKRIVEFHPEVNRFAAENLELRETLSGFEDYLSDLQEIERVRNEWKQYEKALSEQIIDLTEQISVQKDQPSAIGSGTPRNDEYVVRKLQGDLERLSINKASEVNQLKLVLKTLQSEVELGNKRINQMNEEAEQLTKNNQELEQTIIKLRDVSASQFESSAQSEDLQLLEQVKGQLCELNAENHRLRHKLDSFEEKTRRLSDFANQSRKSSQAQLQELTKQVESLTATNLDFDKQVSDLALNLAARQEEVKRLVDERSLLANEKDELEREVLNYAAENRSKDDLLESMTNNYQTAKNELEEAQVEIELLTGQVKTLQDKTLADLENIKNTEDSLREALAKITLLEGELKRMEEALKCQDLASVELADALHKCGNQAALISQYETRLSTLSDQISSMNSEKISLEDQKSMLENEMERERKAMRDLHAKYTEERQELISYRKQVEDLKMDLQTVQSTVMELESKNSQLHEMNTRIQELERERESVRAALEMAQEDNNDLLVRIQNLDEIKATALEYEKQVAELKAECSKQKEELFASDAQLKSERSRINAISDKLGQLNELHGQNKSLEQQFEYILKRNQELEEANGKLVKHNNFKQKLQYHLQIKQENNQLRMENQKLVLELEKRMKSSEEPAQRDRTTMSLRNHK